MLRASTIAMLVLLGTPQISLAGIARGDGAVSCGQWTAGREAADQRPAFGMEAWVLGFLSHGNVNAEASDILVNTDPAAIFGWLDNYCQTHPLQDLPNAVSALEFHMLARAAR